MNNVLDTANNINLNSDFKTALNLSEQELDYNSLIEYLKNGKDVEKQLAVLELSEIKSKEDAFVLVSNLIGQDGKIREVVAFKLNELIKNDKFRNYFIGEDFFEIFRQGIMDINGNICRMVVELTDVQEFKEYLCNHLPSTLEKTLTVIDNLSKDEKQYKISKRNFQLYWCLEALYNIIDNVAIEKIKEVLFKTAKFEDYTIREKASKILAKIDNPIFDDMKEKLKHDENYYVRRYLL